MLKQALASEMFFYIDVYNGKLRKQRQVADIQHPRGVARKGVLQVLSRSEVSLAELFAVFASLTNFRHLQMRSPDLPSENNVKSNNKIKVVKARTIVTLSYMFSRPKKRWAKIQEVFFKSWSRCNLAYVLFS